MNKKKARLARVSCYKVVIKRVLRNSIKLRLTQRVRVVEVNFLRVSLKVVATGLIVTRSLNNNNMLSTTNRSWQILIISKSNL